MLNSPILICVIELKISSLKKKERKNLFPFQIVVAQNMFKIFAFCVYPFIVESRYEKEFRKA